MARDGIEKVFVQLPVDHESGAPTLEWILNHFDREKTKIILTPYCGDTDVNKFQDVSKTNYIPRCAMEKFKVKTLIPNALENYQPTIVELITEHGMNKLVTTGDKVTISETSKVFDEKLNLSCKIWFVNKSDGKLVSTRCYDPGNAEMIAEALVENEKLKKKVEKETIRREKFEEKLRSMTEQEKINKKEIDDLRQKIALSNTITFQELKQATQNFSDSLKIGNSEFGRVYKSTFRGRTVAIKKFKSQSKLDLEVLKREVAFFSILMHPNLVTYIGACLEPPALVYEFLSRGSLHNYLNNAGNTTPLSWQVRTRIIGEVCEALIFLHTNKSNPIIHGDLRPHNILLDANFTSKLRCFGLIKLADRDTDNYPVSSTAYMDPDTGKMTIKSDVYAFGVLILHLITGNSRFITHSEIVKEKIENDTLREIIDKSAGEWPLTRAKELAMIGVRCANIHKSERPDLVHDVRPIVKHLVKLSNKIVHERGVSSSDQGRA